MPYQSQENFCCVNCFDDNQIKDFISLADQMGDCDYCGSRSVNIADVWETGRFVKEGIERVYEDAAEHIPHDSSEGGYQFPTETISDILDDKWSWIFSERLKDRTELIEDLGIDDSTPYVRKDPFGPVSGEHVERWEEFCDKVKREKRFTVLTDSERLDDWEEEHPKNFLKQVTTWMYHELVNDLVPGTRIYRARRLTDGRSLKHRDLTAAPPEKSGNNRMSPAGISFFYGALELETAVAEVRPGLSDQLDIGVFKARNPLRVIDFTWIPKSTSPLSDDYSFHFEEFVRPFLQEFAEDISKPIRPDDSAIDYVPTQISTEFIRYSKIEDDEDIHGIVYRSSTRDGGKCIVLFKGPDVSCTVGKPHTEALLTYIGKRERIITIVPSDLRFEFTNLDLADNICERYHQ